MAGPRQHNARTLWVIALLALVFVWTTWMLVPSSHFSDLISTGPKTSISSPPTSTPAEIAGSASSSIAIVGDHHSGKALPKADRPLILYAYSESTTAQANLRFFLAHALHANAEFVFILNGDTTVEQWIPKEENIRVVKRPNDCFDLGAYAEVLVKDDLWKGYKKFIMLNASIRGPFIPYWAKTCWSDAYLTRVTDKVKLVGMTGNCWPRFHVQSMIWATDSVGMGVLLYPPSTKATEEIPKPAKAVGINSCFHGWDAAVAAEIGASSVITNAGYNLDVMMSLFHTDRDYIKHCDSSTNGDVLWNKGYKGINVNPYETIFIKTNRNVEPLVIQRLTEWADGSNYTSYDYC